ncbi:hypothetical protein CEXT_622761 [Caerostris extrusa]|uniref:Uncharacterized protein n=1 Tax=Caerostris extrusa TaxID=172846 RepID=A0AAV4QBQ5_CAEEX|nr:hypothetical protein CEXT_622761 [Caerostris extrusa]
MDGEAQGRREQIRMFRGGVSRVFWIFEMALFMSTLKCVVTWFYYVKILLPSSDLASPGKSDQRPRTTSPRALLSCAKRNLNGYFQKQHNHTITRNSAVPTTNKGTVDFLHKPASKKEGKKIITVSTPTPQSGWGEKILSIWHLRENGAGA